MGQKANVDEHHYCREIVGLSRWQLPHTLSAEQHAEKDKFDSTPLPKPEGWNMELDKDFFDALEERYEKWVDDSKDYCVSTLDCLVPSPLPIPSLHMLEPLITIKNQSSLITTIDLLGLSVLPTHQRRGLGTMLLREGLAMADEAGAKTYLESSAKGESLYLRHGFKQVDDILIDMRPHGGSRVESEKCMAREAGGR